MNRNTNSISDEEWLAIDDAAWNFEKQWRNNDTPPEIRDFLNGSKFDASIAETLIGIDIEFAWKSERRPSIESYFQLFSAGQLTDDRLWALITFEIEARERTGATVDFDGFRNRFPGFAMRFTKMENDDSDIVVPTNRWTDTWRVSQGDCVRQYELRKKIGHGAFAEVWMAHDRKLGRDVAIKILHASHSRLPDATDRMEREARAIAQLEHRSIVGVYDCGTFRKRPFIVSKLVSGETLAQKLKRTTRIEETEAISIFLDIAEALAEVHRAGIIHRDIKPANILIDHENIPCLADFGLAAETELQSGHSEGNENLVGTPAYMSPEQAIGDLDSIDHRSDIFSVGSTLYHAITGKLPHIDGNRTLLSLFASTPPRPKSVCKNISTELDAICFRCIQKLPSDRYQSADELAQDLRCCLPDKRPLNRSIHYKFKPQQRRRMTIAGTMLVAIGFLLAIEFFVGGIRSTRRDQENDMLSSSAMLQAKRDQQTLGRISFEAGQMAMRDAKYKDAIEHFERAIAYQFAETHQARFGICRAMFSSDDVPNAGVAFRKLTEEDKSKLPPGDILILRADLSKRGEREFGDAVDQYAAALQHDLTIAQKEYVLAMCARTCQESVQHLRSALIANPMQLEARRTLILLLIGMRQFEDARLQLEVATRIFPEDCVFNRLRAIAFCASGRDLEPFELSTFAQHQSDEFDRMKSAVRNLNSQRAEIPSTERLVDALKTILNEVMPYLKGRTTLPPQIAQTFKAALVAHRYRGLDGETEVKITTEIANTHPDPWLAELQRQVNLNSR